MTAGPTAAELAAGRAQFEAGPTAAELAAGRAQFEAQLHSRRANGDDLGADSGSSSDCVDSDGAEPRTPEPPPRAQGQRKGAGAVERVATAANKALQAAGMMRLQVILLAGGRQDVWVPGDGKVGDLKAALERQEGTPAAEQRLAAIAAPRADGGSPYENSPRGTEGRSKQLADDDAPLAAYGLRHGALLLLVQRLPLAARDFSQGHRPGGDSSPSSFPSSPPGLSLLLGSSLGASGFSSFLCSPVLRSPASPPMQGLWEGRALDAAAHRPQPLGALPAEFAPAATSSPLPRRPSPVAKPRPEPRPARSLATELAAGRAQFETAMLGCRAGGEPRIGCATGSDNSNSDSGEEGGGGGGTQLPLPVFSGLLSSTVARPLSAERRRKLAQRAAAVAAESEADARAAAAAAAAQNAGRDRSAVAEAAAQAVSAAEAKAAGGRRPARKARAAKVAVAHGQRGANPSSGSEGELGRWWVRTS